MGSCLPLHAGHCYLFRFAKNIWNKIDEPYAGNVLFGLLSGREGRQLCSLLLDSIVAVAKQSRCSSFQVLAFDLSTLKHKMTYDLRKYGKVWALRMGPYGSLLALTWQEDRAAHLVDVEHSVRAWELPGLEKLYPHDFAIGPAELELNGAGDRLFAVYVAPLCGECGALRKFVLASKVPPVCSHYHVILLSAVRCLFHVRLKFTARLGITQHRCCCCI